MSLAMAAVQGPAPGLRALHLAAALWLVVALLGQWAFAYYIAAFYGGSIAAGDFEVWNRLQAFGRTPFVEGDGIGNLTFLTHALGAGWVALAGALQFVPTLRARFPRFHRWNGRVFLLTVTALSLTGFYLVWVRGPRPGEFTDYATSINGLLILGFAGLAYRAVRARDIPAHRRWALRLYLVANAQWFIRIGVFSYFVLHQAFGSRASFKDPFFDLWTFGCYLLPLAVAELYLRAQRAGARAARLAVAALLLALTLAMAAGMLGFALFSQRMIDGAPLAVPG